MVPKVFFFPRKNKVQIKNFIYNFLGHLPRFRSPVLYCSELMLWSFLVNSHLASPAKMPLGHALFSLKHMQFPSRMGFYSCAMILMSKNTLVNVNGVISEPDTFSSHQNTNTFYFILRGFFSHAYYISRLFPTKWENLIWNLHPYCPLGSTVTMG